MRFILILLFLLTGCNQISYSHKDYPEFRVDKKIKYRLWYGKLPYQWIDVARANCAILEGKLTCQYEDLSPIISLSEVGHSIIQKDFIEIKKEKSTWYLCNFRSESDMFLMVGDAIVYLNE